MGKMRKGIFAFSCMLCMLLLATCSVYAADGKKMPSNSKTVNRTQDEVYELYDGSIKSYDTSGLFETLPALEKGNYNPGKLSQDAENKTVSQINYFRNLAGLNSNMVAYTDRINAGYGQCGATGMEIVSKLTHKFTSAQLSTLENYMSEEQLAMAQAGIDSGNTDTVYRLWNANCSSTNNVVTSIQGYMDDTNNVSSGVGHRLNMLDMNGQAVVMGAGKSRYSCVTIYGNPFQSANPNTEAYYPWPCEGCFPKQSIANTAMWSVAFNSSYSYTDASDIAVNVTYNGTNYSCESPIIDMNYNGKCITVAYALPDAVLTAIKSTSTLYQNDATVDVTVKVTGLKDSAGNACYAQYTTKLFNRIPVTSISLQETSIEMNAGTAQALTLTYAPADATDAGNITWSSSDESVATVDNTGKVTARGIGEAEITAQIRTLKANCKVKVTKELADCSVGDIDSLTYTGAALTPELVVKDGTKVLTKGMDYELSYKDNVNAGTATVTLKGKGSYTGTVARTFAILPKKLTDEAISDIADVTYSGNILKPAITVSDGTVVLVQGTDYTVVYQDNLDAGTAQVTVEFTGNYVGTLTKNFMIQPKAIGLAEAEKIADQEYTGSPIVPIVTLRDGDTILKQGIDYRVTATDNIVVGISKVKIEGIGNYQGTYDTQFTITPCSVEGAEVDEIAAVIYTGSEYKPAVTMTVQGNVLKEDEDYSLDYVDNTDAGEATVKINGTGNYTGTKTVHFTIKPRELAQSALSEISDAIYTGSSIMPSVAVFDGEKELKAEKDYTVSYEDNLDAGEAAVVVKLQGNYTGTLTGNFTISPKSLENARMEAIADQEYTGNMIVPDVTVWDGDVLLKQGTDYIVTGASDNIPVGIGKVKVEGKGNYQGTLDGEFTIKARSMENTEVNEIAAVSYTGNEHKPSVTVTVQGNELEEDKDYSLDYADNTDAGEATVKINGMGNYTGTKTVHFTIIPRELSQAAVSEIPDAVYTGNAITPSVTVVDGERELEADTDYIVVYEDNTNAGEAAVTIKLQGNYTGTLTKDFTISPKSLENASVEEIADQVYTGSAIVPSLTVRDGGTVLAQDVDYSVKGVQNTETGEASLTIVGEGNYTGTLDVKFNIIHRDITDVTVNDIADETYDGSAHEPEIILQDGDTQLQPGRDYSVEYSGNVNAGVVVVKITGLNGYTGTIEKSFVIKKKELGKAAISTVGSQKYTGKAIKPAITVKNGDITLGQGDDYTVSYSNNTRIGTATITVRFMGNYSGSAAVTFKIVANVIKGKAYKVSSSYYLVTSSTTVAYQKPSSKSVKTLTIPSTVKIQGKTFKVTTIKANALKNCKRLKTITIKSTYIKKVETNAIKGIYKKAKIKVPSSKYKTYKKLFNKKSGFVSTMTIRK